MEASLIKIGNSQGLIIPKRLLNKLGSSGKFNIEEKEGCLLFVPIREEKPRENWDKIFSLAKINGVGQPEDPCGAISNDFDETEWTW